MKKHELGFNSLMEFLANKITCRSWLCPTKSPLPRLGTSYRPGPCSPLENIQKVLCCDLFLKGSVMKHMSESSIKMGKHMNEGTKEYDNKMLGFECQDGF